MTPRKGRAVDVSIERCYVQAIRRARRFIYVENQFFMGSAYAWLRDSSVKCHNVVPMEIAQKICQNIKDGTPCVMQPTSTCIDIRPLKKIIPDQVSRVRVAPDAL